MPPKKQLPAPIDRPLSKAYVREFKGWSTAEPPGLSDPTTLRIMENVQINRDGSCRVRPGMRYLSYAVAPYDARLAQPSAVLVASNEDHTDSAAGNQEIFELAFPVGTQEGDIVVLSLIGGGQTPGYSVLGDADCFDARMTKVHEVVLDETGPNSNEQRRTSVWIGYASDLATPLDIYLKYGAVTGNPFVQFASACVSVWRGDTAPLEWTAELVESTPSSLAIDGEIPGVVAPGTAGGILVWQMSRSAIGGVAGGSQPFENFDWSNNPLWLEGAEGGAGYIQTSFRYALESPVPPGPTAVMEPSADTAWTATVIGLRSSSIWSGPVGGTAVDRPFVGTHEAFYLNDGTKAYLTAVREVDSTVGFRVLVVDTNHSTMYDLTDPIVGFEVRQPTEVLNFSAGTTHVQYLQIDNKIFALSDNGENMRVFSVGAFKEAKALNSIERPEWDNDDKLTVVHPDSAWILNGEPDGKRRNRIHNPSFERNYEFWNKGLTTLWNRPASPPMVPVSGDHVLKLQSKPTRTNLIEAPLYDVATTGVMGWDGALTWVQPAGNVAAQVEMSPTVTADGAWLKMETPAYKGTFYARTRRLPGIEPGERYRVAYNSDNGAHIWPKCKVRFIGVNGTQVGNEVELDVDAVGGTRWVSEKILAPKGAVSARVYIGGENRNNAVTYVKAKDVLLSPAGEGTDIFHGGSGVDYFWTDQPNESASVYHPPANIHVYTDKTGARPTKDHTASVHVQSDVIRNVTVSMRLYNKNNQLLEVATTTDPSTVGSWTRIEATQLAAHNKAVQADLTVTIPDVPRGEYHYLDAAMLEANAATAGTYFDGSTADVPTAHNEWRGKKHASVSIQETFLVGATIPPAETRTPNTLLSDGGREVNVHTFGFFYTFSNEVGESAASKIRVKRAQRAWSDWAWEKPNAAGEPGGDETNNPNLCADQLVAIIPQEVYDDALAMGATEWSLYMFSWSDQDAVPVVAQKVGTRELPPDADYQMCGWIRVTPSMADITDEAILPSKENIYNYSDPSRGGQGLVAADRMIVVNDPTDAAVIRWSSNKAGEYTNFTASKGGGYKTLTSGNLFVPACAKLWQNPQSADTITVLCLGTDSYSTSYYMAPAQVASQSEAVNVMGFEETTATPGTTSPYGVEVFNNSLYHPLDDQLMKSTASNYNINHKSQTDLIRNQWEKLKDKYWIMSSQHDGCLYYLVHNPEGAELEENCKGNELWVFDATSKTGTWSRFLIQAQALRKIEFGGRIYMSVIRHDGVYYLDPSYNMDDYVNAELGVEAKAIPWKLETNTHGANRAHDAWCHLQQVSVALGYFQGRMRYGIKGVDIHGKYLTPEKIVRDEAPGSLPAWDIEDHLSVRRDLKEWFFFAESITDDDGVVEPSYGQISLVQYRYTPSSVNTGYELGSVETFEYGRDVALAETTSANGIPLPLQDSRRP